MSDYYRFEDLLAKENIPISDVAVIFHSNRNTEFDICSKKEREYPGMIDEYQRFQCNDKKTDYFADKEYVFSFIRADRQMAFFHGCYVNNGPIEYPDRSVLAIKDYDDFPLKLEGKSWYDWIGKPHPKGHGMQYYYLLEKSPYFADLQKKMVMYNCAVKTVQHTKDTLSGMMISIDDFKLKKKYFG